MIFFESSIQARTSSDLYYCSSRRRMMHTVPLRLRRPVRHRRIKTLRTQAAITRRFTCAQTQLFVICLRLSARTTSLSKRYLPSSCPIYRVQSVDTNSLHCRPRPPHILCLFVSRLQYTTGRRQPKAVHRGGMLPSRSRLRPWCWCSWRRTGILIVVAASMRTRLTAMQEDRLRKEGCCSAVSGRRVCEVPPAGGRGCRLVNTQVSSMPAA
ncbi:hypothetical protein R3P38DRAFT_3071130 [Favolaschia claudopus]|uniref:Uncharacterized protein n=1 Tax=Favolaschia claudopus TaxID=2862362 RepID=A0AAV9ZYZ8_9AGAR